MTDKRAQEIIDQVMTDERAQEIIDQALESCSLDLRNVVAIITGLMGSGKTWLLSRLFGQIPPHLYTSTGVAEQSMRGLLHHIASLSSNSWEPFSHSHILQLLACLFNLLPPQVELSASPAIASASTSLSPTSISSPATSSQLAESSPTATTSSSPEVPHLPESLPAAKSSTMQSMVRLVKSSKNTENSEMLELVHMIDTGGQPELLENMPSLIQHSHLAVLVLNLMFGLDDHLSIDFHEEGKAYKRVLPSQFSNRQIIQKLASTLQAKRFSQKGQSFRLLVVATHRDCVPQGELPAMVKAFDQALRDILLPSSKKELIRFSASQIPFVVNLKEPNRDDWERLDLVRSKISESEVGEVVKTPGSFLVFEQELMELAKKDPRGILSCSECLEIGTRLKMKPEEVEAALIFFHRQFTLLYFRHVLPNLVFTRPQTPLDCINAVVRFSYKVESGEVKGVSEDLVSSLRDGIITEEILSHKELTQCFIPHLYEPQHAIELLSHTFTLAPLSREIQPPLDSDHPATSQPSPSIEREKREYLMMSLRSAIPDKKVPQHLPPPSEIAPLVVQFTKNCVPLSCFSRTISCLLAMYDWKLSRADDGSPQCLAHNVISLYKPQTPGQIVLVDMGHSFHVHIRPSKGLDQNDMTKICSQVKDTIITAVKVVFARLSLTKIESSAAFICGCEKKPLSHPASSFFFNSKWLLRCSLHEQHVDPATDCHLMWLQTSPTESKKPTFLQLYDLNVLEEVGTHYRILGTFLLRDDTGCIVDAIELDSLRQTHTITMKILQRWLLGKGEPVTWDTLVKILHRCKLDTLADKIQQQYRS